MIDNPTDIEKNCQGNETGAKRNEKRDRFATAGDPHRLAILVHTGGVCTLRRMQNPVSELAWPGSLGRPEARSCCLLLGSEGVK